MRTNARLAVARPTTNGSRHCRFSGPDEAALNTVPHGIRRLLREQLTDVLLPPAREFRREFVSDVEAVGDGVATLKYLSRYVFFTAITNDRIVSRSNHQVTFFYRKSGKQRDRQITLPVFEFLRRFLQHVLFRRLQKLRHYAFLTRRSNIDDVRDATLYSLRHVEPDRELEA